MICIFGRTQTSYKIMTQQIDYATLVKHPRITALSDIVPISIQMDMQSPFIMVLEAIEALVEVHHAGAVERYSS